MRCLIVGGSPDADALLVATLAASIDRVVAADGGASLCDAAGVVPDAIVGDMDSVTRELLDSLSAEGANVARSNADKDVTDLSLAVDHARSLGATEVLFTGILGGRLDHTLAALDVVMRSCDLIPSIREKGQRGWAISARGPRERLQLSGKGATVSVFAWHPRTRVVTVGLKWGLDGEKLPLLSERGLSNVLVEERATITAKAGCALVLTSRVGDVPPAVKVES